MKSKWFKCSGLLILAVLAALLATHALAAAGDTTRVSVATDGTEGNDASGAAILSADGRYATFASRASNLVTGDTNGYMDIFLHDMQTGLTTRVSVASDGTQANFTSGYEDISADGRYIVFDSYANNLVPGDINIMTDVFLHDMQNGTTVLVSVSSSGAQGNNHSDVAFISDDGRYVAFRSSASNLVAGDGNEQADVFLHDTQSGKTTLISIASDGTQGNGESFPCDISANGRYVLFNSFANNLVPNDNNGQADVFLRDTQNETTTRISLGPNGQEGNNSSFAGSITPNGRYVGFWSTASNLVIGDTNGTQDVFVRDLQIGKTTRISIATDGTQGNGTSGGVSISSDGRYVAFDSWSWNLVAGDTNGWVDVFLRDVQAGTTKRISIASDGTEAYGGPSGLGNISFDGRYVGFASNANNLVPGDTNGWDDDAFIHETDAILYTSHLYLPLLVK